MEPYHTTDRVTLYLGDCVEVLRALPEASVDAVVTDPPYGIGFMGKGWDSHGSPIAFQRWCEAWAREAYRVLKPGGHLAAFGGPRTYHRLASGIEDAGFGVRDSLMWLFGSGFPKSLDVSKAIDKAVGAEPTDGLAQKWHGWGTALKPAYEPIVLARKSLDGTVATNVLAHGTGALNVDGTRVGHERMVVSRSTGALTGKSGVAMAAPYTEGEIVGTREGRWPASVVLGEEAAALLDGQVRESVSAAQVGYADRGGPSRFFYTAKASRFEREAGLDDLAPRVVNEDRPPGTRGGNHPRAGVGRGQDGVGALRDGGHGTRRRNDHPTVKPVDLMRWLCRLVTPPGGAVLDPFLGSGSTALAALDAGFRVVGIEREPHYLEIARRRIAYWHDVAEEPIPPTAGRQQGRLL